MADSGHAPRKMHESSSVLVRRARPTDLSEVGAVTVRAYVEDGFVAADDAYLGQLSDAAGRLAQAELWVAELGGVLVGTVTFCPPGSIYRELATDREGEFRMLAVDPSSRGRGVARALVRRCLERCDELELTELVMCSLRQMTPAHALYVAMGFTRDPALDWEVHPGVTLIGFRTQV